MWARGHCMLALLHQIKIMHINPWFWRFSLFCYEPVQHIYFFAELLYSIVYSARWVSIGLNGDEGKATHREHTRGVFYPNTKHLIRQDFSCGVDKPIFLSKYGLKTFILQVEVKQMPIYVGGQWGHSPEKLSLLPPPPWINTNINYNCTEYS